MLSLLNIVQADISNKVASEYENNTMHNSLHNAEILVQNIAQVRRNCKQQLMHLKWFQQDKLSKH
jgi:hypothetical protein